MKKWIVILMIAVIVFIKAGDIMTLIEEAKADEEPPKLEIYHMNEKKHIIKDEKGNTLGVVVIKEDSE